MSTKHQNLKLNPIPLQERYPDSAETEACKMMSKIELFYKIQEDTGLADKLSITNNTIKNKSTFFISIYLQVV